MTTEPITPVFFYDALVTVLTIYRDDLATLWGKTATEYTRFIFDAVLPEVGRLINLECYPKNYYHIDSIYYEECDVENFSKGTYAKYIAVALEHENDLSGTCAEMNKLQLFNAPLKVLITYVSHSSVEAWLPRYVDIIKKADIFQDAATLRRQLVVFGEKPEREGFPVWRGFVYEPEGFVELGNQ